MNKSYTKKQYIIFALTAYGISLGFGIPLQFNRYMKPSILANLMMVLPAAGAALAQVIGSKEKTSLSRFHCILIVNMVVNILLVILRICGVLSDDGIEICLTACALVASIALLLDAWMSVKELDPFYNLKKGIVPVLFFIVINLIEGFVLNWRHLDIGSTVSTLVMSLPALVFQIVFFFGEEYGWRGFLQGPMQRRFGKRGGVILLGLIWELWHMPLWFTLYGMTAYGIALRFFSTTGIAIFIGWLYMRTSNVWLCAAVHFFNNVISTTIMENSAMTADRGSLTGIIISIGGRLVLWSFLFAKEYRKTEVEKPADNEYNKPEIISTEQEDSN